MKTALSVCWGKRPVPPILFEGLSEGIDAASKLGFDGIEISGDVTKLDRFALMTDLKKAGLCVSTVLTAAISNNGATLSSEDSDLADTAIAALFQAIDLASDLDAIVSLGLVVGKLEADPEKVSTALSRLVQNLIVVTDYAQRKEVNIAIEPVCRYLNTLVQNVDQALAIIEKVGADNLGVTLDLFHMNIEESSSVDAIKRAGKRVFNVQLADNNRHSIGKGQIDFIPILKALNEIGYEGWVSSEILPLPTPYIAASEWMNSLNKLTNETQPLTGAQMDALCEKLNADPVFQERAKHFVGSVTFMMGSSPWTVWFNGGTIVRTVPAVPIESPDFTLSGPMEEWEEIYKGERHLLKALNPYHGRMSLTGNIPKFASNLRPIFYMISAMKWVA